MRTKTLIAVFATVAASFAASSIVRATQQEQPYVQSAIPKATRSGHVAVNGVSYYYAVFGTGEPLLLLRSDGDVAPR